MRGRHPSGPEFVSKLAGSDAAKLRVEVVLRTMSGELSVKEACDFLDICEQRFDQLRIEMLQAAIERLEPQAVGRRAREVTPAEADNQRLREQLGTLQAELQAAKLRAEIALTLPQVGSSPEKKMSTKRPT